MNRRMWLGLQARGMAAALLNRLLIPTKATMNYPQANLPDYARVDRLRQMAQNKVFKERLSPHWFAGGDRFWYRNDLAGGRREFIAVDAVKGIRQRAFDHSRMAKALSALMGKKIQADRLPIEALEFQDGDSQLLIYNPTQAWECDLRTYTLRPFQGPIPGLGTIRPEARPHRSARTGPETMLTFLNETGEDALLFWIDTDGNRKDYGVIPPQGRRTQHTFSGHVWLVTDRAGKTLGVFEATDDPGTAVVDGKAAPEPVDRGDAAAHEDGVPSPDGKMTAFVRDENIWVRRNPGEEIALTKDGIAGDGYHGPLLWSPDSRRLAALKTLAGEDHKIYFVESSPPDQVQPKLHALDYLKPGDRIAITKPHLFDAVASKEIPVDDALFPNPWEISDLSWAPDSSRLMFLYNQRGHQVLRVVGVNAETGQANAVVDERSSTFIDYAGKYFSEYLPKSDEIVWMSERDGWNHLYLYNAKSGRVINQITRGEWVVRGVDRVDAEKRQIWFRAGGIEPGQDPYYIHYCRVNLDGTGLVKLTEGDGTHSINYSPDRRFFIDSYSRVDLPPVHELRRSADGKRLCELETADASALLATGWKPPERFVTKGRDGKTDIYGVILRPTGFDPAQHYPVIENIYAGPQDSYVPKAWSTRYGMQDIAELGFIVVQIDGMGTSNRSKAFHNVCWKNLADAGFSDRIPWIRAAAATRPYMDLSRVGIYGGSAGGQNALRGLLAHGDFYHVGLADCGCHDNRMDKIWWNELWMGWPVGPEYAEQSNVTNAHLLTGALVLMVGEMDNNVDPASTMQVVNALVKANKDFEMLIQPGVAHGSAETPYGSRRRQEFFVRRLLEEKASG